MKSPKPEQKKVRKPSTPEQRAQRRANRWRKTGVSQSTINWMNERGML